MDLYKDFRNLNRLCQQNKLYWFIKYNYHICKYEGRLDSGNVDGLLTLIEADYLDDLVHRLTEAIESLH